MKSVVHPNFYENIKEAQMRLVQSIVVYDGEPYYVNAIHDHRADGIFRVYMEPIGTGKTLLEHRTMGFPTQEFPNTTERGEKLDKWMTDNPNSGMIRKMLNSPSFNKFRPFSLGMMNTGDGKVNFLERHPQRHTQQGLIQNMIQSTPVVLTDQQDSRGRLSHLRSTDIYGVAFKECVMGVYPTFGECVLAFADPEISNDAVAFDRNFALVRGPLDTLYLNYKGDLVGFLPNGDGTCIRLSETTAHCKQVIEALNIFSDIIIK